MHKRRIRGKNGEERRRVREEVEVVRRRKRGGGGGLRVDLHEVSRFLQT